VATLPAASVPGYQASEQRGLCPSRLNIPERLSSYIIVTFELPLSTVFRY